MEDSELPSAPWCKQDQLLLWMEAFNKKALFCVCCYLRLGTVTNVSLQGIFDIVGGSGRLGQKVEAERYEMASVEAGKLLAIEIKENEAWTVGKWETKADSPLQAT